MVIIVIARVGFDRLGLGALTSRIVASRFGSNNYLGRTGQDMVFFAFALVVLFLTTTRTSLANRAGDKSGLAWVGARIRLRV